MREHTEAIQPPRALWVPFPLGRPLGLPDDPVFQTRVLRAALSLVERPRGPVLEDFPDDLPDVHAEDEELTIAACPIPARGGGPAPTPRELIAREIAFLRPWHRLGEERRGYTTAGVSGLAPEQAGELLATWLEQGDAAGIASERLKLAIDDLRAFCLEAGAAQPGGATGPRLERWFWWETAIGAALRDAHPQALASDDPAIRFMAKVLMIPVAQRGD
ncbi:MAG: hypothetical protein R3C15_01885 [Thermoleophilia bacterium]